MELVIVGAGPAGLTAGIYSGRSGLQTLLLEEKMAGGEAAVAPWIENYPGFEYISGPELIEKMISHCKKFGAKINELEEVTALSLRDKKMLVKTSKASYSTNAVIITNGTHYRLLNVPGEKEFQGRGVSYCALCDGAFFKNKKVIVVGGGNTATKSARYLSNVAAEVKLIHRRKQLRAEKASVEALKEHNVKFIWDSEIAEIKGDSVVKTVVIRNNKTKAERELRIDGVFVQIGEVPNTSFAKEAGILLDINDYIIVDSRQRTNIPGVFAAGDVTNCPVKQIGTAVGQAIVAATESFGYIKRPYYYKS